MSRFIGKGGRKSKRNKKRPGIGDRGLRIAEEYELYGRVIKKFGGEWMEVECSDGITRLGKIRGKFRKRVWINPEDIVLLSLREFEKESKKADIIHKYREHEARTLNNLGHIDFEIRTTGGDEEQDFARGRIKFGQADDLSEDSFDDSDIDEGREKKIKFRTQPDWDDEDEEDGEDEEDEEDEDEEDEDGHEADGDVIAKGTTASADTGVDLEFDEEGNVLVDEEDYAILQEYYEKQKAKESKKEAKKNAETKTTKDNSKDDDNSDFDIDDI